jgi:hypothetical protein
MISCPRRGVLCLAFLVTLLPVIAQAQQFKANLTGTVTDGQGAVIPGVTVVVTNTETNVPAESVTDANGFFVVKDVVPGSYKVTASLPGFKTFVRGGIVLHTAETATIAVKLDLGNVEETVTVSAGLSAVESNQGVLSQTMDNKKVSELPLNGRQVYMLKTHVGHALHPAVRASGFSGTRVGRQRQHRRSTAATATTVLIDGASTPAPTAGYAPPVDAIESSRSTPRARTRPTGMRRRRQPDAGQARTSCTDRRRRSSRNRARFEPDQNKLNNI